MEKLSIEQKAKAYDKAKINGSRLWKCGEITRENYEYMFPEIEENEDDKIRKTLIHIVKGACDKYGIKYKGEEISEEKLLGWLEKQGETFTKKDVDDAYLKGVCDTKQELEKQVEQKPVISDDALREGIAYFGITQYQIDNWLKKYVDVEKQGEKKPEWNEEDENIINNLLAICSGAKRYRQFAGCSQDDVTKYQTWLKSLRPQYRWKPSEEMLEALYKVIPENTKEISEEEILLGKLYQGLKYGKVLNEKI